MKKLLGIFFAFVMMFSTVDQTAVTVQAEEVGGSDFQYRDYGEDGIEITGYTDVGITNLVIPDTIDGKQVVSIGAQTFLNCSSLTSVEIPKGVTSIGDSAFSGCSGLVSVEIPDGVTGIESGAFSGCRSLISVAIPDGVTSIEPRTFQYCNSLTDVVIPEEVTSIGISAFDSCYSLTSVAIPEGVTRIEERTFFGCSSLANVAMPEGVTSIGEYAFACCGLENVVIPESVESIGEYAFGIGSKPLSITIPKNIKKIGYRAFTGSNNVCTDVYYSGTKKEWSSIYNYKDTENIIIHCSDGDINDMENTNNSGGTNENKEYDAGTKIGGILFKPGIPCTAKGLDINVVSVTEGSSFFYAEIVVKNSTGYNTDPTDIAYKCYKNSNTLLRSNELWVEALEAGESYETFIMEPVETKILIFGDGAKSYATGISSTNKKANEGAMGYLKGMWGTAHQTMDSSGNYVCWDYVKFTEQCAKYYRKDNGRLTYVEKYKIVSIKKLKNKKGKLSGYLIKLQKGNHKQSYRLFLKEPNILHYFGSWSKKHYSGSRSLEKL